MRVCVVQAIHCRAICAGNEVPVRVDGDLERRVSELICDCERTTVRCPEDVNARLNSWISTGFAPASFRNNS